MKTAIVLGASGGLGSAIASILAEEYTVIGTHHGKEHPEIRNVTWKALDLADASSVKRFCEGISSVDVLVDTVAAPLKVQRFHQIPLQAFQEDYAINVLHPLLLLQTLLPKFTKNGSAIFVLSEMIYETPAFFSSYAISKYALLGLVKSLGAELKEVRVNGVAPGMMDTKYIKTLPAFVKEQYAKAKGLVKPEKVAQAVKKLIDSETRGEVVRV
ncbi:MAG: SDR family oxidoreductase [Nanoarchaeota archaeon]|nr:SDR family oxidoreductase [Nanoarchaeota archaeon]